MKLNATLQINVSAGDLAYCEKTVPALVAAHQDEVLEKVAVVDCCRPKGTPFLHARSRFPQYEFNSRVQQLKVIVQRWHSQGLFDRIVYIEPDDPQLRDLSRKYTGLSSAYSHDHLGHAFAAYWAAWEYSQGRFVLHYDADILLYQEEGYSWARDACTALDADVSLIAASPRIAPPPNNENMVSVDESGSGWLPTWKLQPATRGWVSDWISTRCHLLERSRLEKYLPLKSHNQILGRTIDAVVSPLYMSPLWTRPLPDSGIRRGAGLLARKLASGVIPPFPLPPEVLLHEQVGRKGGGTLYLSSKRAWFIHPDTKPEAFLNTLPKMLEAIQRGQAPEAQRGLSGIQYEAWESFLNAQP